MAHEHPCPECGFEVAVIPDWESIPDRDTGWIDTTCPICRGEEAPFPCEDCELGLRGTCDECGGGGAVGCYDGVIYYELTCPECNGAGETP